MRWAVVAGNMVGGLVISIQEGDQVVGDYFGWVHSETAQIGDQWLGGTNFITPPPSLAQYRAVLDEVLLAEETALRETTRNALRDSILLTLPPEVPLEDFRTAVENRTV